jgi:hypothetical protein
MQFKNGELLYKRSDGKIIELAAICTSEEAANSYCEQHQNQRAIAIYNDPHFSGEEFHLIGKP